MYGKAYSTSALQGMAHAISFNFILCRDPVNIPVQEKNATCRIIASAGSFDVLVRKSHYKTVHFAYQDGGREFDALVCKSIKKHFAYHDGGIATIARMR